MLGPNFAHPTFIQNIDSTVAMIDNEAITTTLTVRFAPRSSRLKEGLIGVSDDTLFVLGAWCSSLLDFSVCEVMNLGVE